MNRNLLRASQRQRAYSLVFVVLALLGGPVLAQSTAPKLLPFQGRLTDQNGVAVSNGVRLVQFKIFDVPAGGSPVWAGELHRTTVNGGLVNVMLGTKTPFTDVDFDRQLYLEITVDINGDNAITLADPPMLPRQAILPVVFAKEAADSRKLNGYDWNNPAPGTLIPVGGVIMWWGSLANIPPGFELCDGGVPQAAGATLPGNKPNLLDRFVKGATASSTDVAAARAMGGTNTIPERISGDTTLTLSQIPAHSHSVNITSQPAGAHAHSMGTGSTDALGVLYGSDARNTGRFAHFNSDIYNRGGPKLTDSSGNHQHTVSGNTEATGGSEAHSHSIPSHDNRPAYLEMFFIIRVK